MAKKNDVALAPKNAMQQTLDFASDAGMGMEGADKDSYAVPFLAILQTNSPQLETVTGAKAGLILNTVTNDLYEQADIIPVAFQRRYLAWAPRAAGGGFRGEHSVGEVESIANPLGVKKTADGQLVMPDGCILKDTRNHFVIVANNGMQAILSLSSTQIKKSKRWMSRQQSIQMKDAAGRTFNPPAFSHMYKLTTVSEENDKGKWKGIVIDLIGPVASVELYEAAKRFHKLIVEGKVNVSAPASDDSATDSDVF